jgi:hypothetical protein
LPTTIVVNPEKQEFNIGVTPYPDITDIIPTRLWIVPVKELKARFLIIQVQPGASASVPMPILYIDQHDHPTLAGCIRQRFQFEVDPRDQPGADPNVGWEGDYHPLRDEMFEKCDKDGILELVEHDVWKEGGSVTYFRFTAHKTFIPVRRETYAYACDDTHPNGGFVMTSRRSLLR